MVPFAIMGVEDGTGSLFRAVHLDMTMVHLRGGTQSTLGLNDTTKLEAAVPDLAQSGH